MQILYLVICVWYKLASWWCMHVEYWSSSGIRNSGSFHSIRTALIPKQKMHILTKKGICTVNNCSDGLGINTTIQLFVILLNGDRSVEHVVMCTLYIIYQNLFALEPTADWCDNVPVGEDALLSFHRTYIVLITPISCCLLTNWWDQKTSLAYSIW
jgi:hypothetical protein